MGSLDHNWSKRVDPRGRIWSVVTIQNRPDHYLIKRGNCKNAQILKKNNCRGKFENFKRSLKNDNVLLF